MKPTQEQVQQWAREAGYLPDGFGFGAWDMKEFNEAITLAYEAGRAAEREACAQIAFNSATYIEAAKAIRARGQHD